MRFEGKQIKIFLENKKINYYNIKMFDLFEKVNVHSNLKIKIEIDKETKKEFEEIIEKENSNLIVKIQTDKDVENEIFNGIIDYFEILHYGNDGYEVYLEIFSKSIMLDRKLEKKYRVFQDTSWTYEKIIDEINKEYKDKKINVIASEVCKKSIENIKIQFDETDWDFLKRLASELQTHIFATSKGIITVGLIENNNEIKEEKSFCNYSIVRNMKNKYYKIFSESNINLADNVLIDGINTGLNVIESNIYLKNNILKSEAMIADLTRYYVERKYNEKIVGNRIEVKVERVFEENNIAKMEVMFYEGLKNLVESSEDNGKNYKAYVDYGLKRFAFSYQTFYSQTNTGFFCTPEINDTVEIYFPNKDEKMAKISWAINNKGNGRFSDYEKRNFHINGKDFNFKIEKDSMEMNLAKSYRRNSKNSVEEAESFVNKSTKNLFIVSDDYMGIESIGDMSVYGESLEIIGKKSDIKIETPGEIRIKGKKVHNN